MKFIAILLTVACISAGASGNSQGVSIDMKDAPIPKVFKEVIKQTGVSILYDMAMFKDARPVTIRANNATVEEVINKCLEGLPYTYSFAGSSIVIKKKDLSIEFRSKDNSAPPIDVKGRVVNENGEPVIASVMVKGTKIGTTTNANGEFQLSGIDENAVLVISGVSIETQEISVVKNASLKTSEGMLIRTITEVTSLKEVVINKGYYTEKQKFSVGNVSTVKAVDIEKQPVLNPILALQGRVTGVEIIQLTGLPGGAVKIRIQGQNSLRSNALDPLIVVDGVPYPTNYFINTRYDDLVQGGSPLNYINPDDIESIDVLKDADATSIYGSRAANGAILITTKKGRSGKTKVSVNVQNGWGKVNRRIDMMNTRQYLDMRYEAFRNDNQIPSNNPSAFPQYAPDLTIWDTTRYTNWQKELIGGTAKYTNVNASISGGNNGIQYLIGGTYRRQTTVFPGDFDDKVGGLHFNIGSMPPDRKLSVQLTGSYMYDDNHLPGVDLTQPALLLEPTAPTLFKDDGTLNWEQDAAGSSTWYNPLALVNGSDNHSTTKNLVSSLNINYAILPGLIIGASAGYTNIQGSHYMPRRIETEAPESRSTSVRSSQFGNREQSNWIIEPQLKYKNKIGKGNFDGLIGATFQKNKGSLLDLSGSGYTNDKLMTSPIAAPNRSIVGATSFAYKYSAFFCRLNYNWKEKYILNLTGRRDGSSRFGNNNKFHNFGSVGAAWIFTEEKFIDRNIPFLSFGKLRGSFGTTGNDQIIDYLYLSTYGISNPQISYQGGSGLVVNRIPNPNLQWEETKKNQVGIDLGFLSDRILLGLTYSRNQSSNQLISYPLPSITGFTGMGRNFPATIRNTSWEFTLHTVNFKTKTFSWSTDLNFTIPQNKLVSFPNIEQTSYADGTNGVIIGQPLGILKKFNYGGVDTATGAYYPLDRNGNPVYFPNFPDFVLDQTAIVSPLSNFYGGLVNSLAYKGFELAFVIQFVKQIGNDDFDYWNGISSPGTYNYGRSNQPATLLNKTRWQKPGDIAEIERYSISARAVWPAYSAESYNHDASFARLKNVSLSWQIPNNWIRKAKLQSGSVYIHGQNLATITKYNRLDPESQSISSLPPLKIWTIGIKLDF